jgi:hypothetical protein
MFINVRGHSSFSFIMNYILNQVLFCIYVILIYEININYAYLLLKLLILSYFHQYPIKAFCDTIFLLKF